MKNFFSLVKFSHTVFALPFALIGFFLAVFHHQYSFSWLTFLLVIMCMVFARSAAMAFNRYADEYIDRQNPRTAQREIPAGIISQNSALLFVIANSLLFILAAYFINTLCFFLSPVALLVVLGYSYTKRFTSLSHLVLGLGLSLAPIGAYLAVTEKFHILPLFYSFAVLFWVAGFDIIYALQDDDFDRAENLYSLPATLGRKMALYLSSLMHFISASFVLVAGFYAGFGLWYWSGAAIFLILLIYQHTLVKPDDLSRVNVAFFTTNGMASIIFAITVILDLWLS